MEQMLLFDELHRARREPFKRDFLCTRGQQVSSEKASLISSIFPWHFKRHCETASDILWTDYLTSLAFFGNPIHNKQSMIDSFVLWDCDIFDFSVTVQTK